VALVGADAIGAPALLDTHRPDAVALATYPSPSSHTPSPSRGEGPALALRRLRPPAPASVTLASGRPVAVRSGRLTGRIVAGVGPWRVSGEWWSPRPWLQDEWDVELADGTLCRLAHDGSTWRLEGIYD
jgi:protein ImuB